MSFRHSLKRNVSFQKALIALDPHILLEGPNGPLYQLQWRTTGAWQRVCGLDAFEVSANSVEAFAALFKRLCFEVTWHLDGLNKPQLRMALVDSVAKMLLPRFLWCSEASEPLSGFHRPEAVTPRLRAGHVELSLPPAARCQVHYVERHDVSAKALASKVLLLPLEFDHPASLRLGDDEVWSEWSVPHKALNTLPELSCEDFQSSGPPVNCKVKLSWSLTCACEGPIPVECIVSIVSKEESVSERLLGMTTCVASGKACGERDGLEVAINGFEPGGHYFFLLRARPQLPSFKDFKEVARSGDFQWPERLSEEFSCYIDWTLPLPRQVLIPDEGELEESSPRWQGRAVLLAWPGSMEGLRLEVREESQHTHPAGTPKSKSIYNTHFQKEYSTYIYIYYRNETMKARSYGTCAIEDPYVGYMSA